MTVKITTSSHNRHEVDSIGAIREMSFGMWEFHGEDGLYSAFSADEFEIQEENNHV